MRELVAAWPPTATASTVSVRKPSDAAYTDAARPAGPAPTTMTSTQRSGSVSAVRPRAAPRSPGVARFNRLRVVIAIGRSAAVTPRLVSRAAVSGSVSASIHWWGTRLRAAYSRSAIDAGVNRSEEHTSELQSLAYL